MGVVVPTYNRAEFLSETLNAIIGQSRQPDQIVVVDDGSTDDTATVLARYASVVRVTRIANSGDLVARNTGLRMLNTDLVAFCDSDDIWRPDFLATMEELWTREPRTRAAYSDFVILRNGIWEEKGKFSNAPSGFWSDLRPIGTHLGIFDFPIVPRLIGFQPFFQSCLVVDRRFFLEIGAWDENVSRIVGGDFATTLRLGEHPHFGIIQRPLVGIRKHAGNYSADVQKMNLGDALVLERVLNDRPSLLPYATLIRTSIARRRQEALSTAFSTKDFSAVLQIYGLLPSDARNKSTRIKHAVANLPTPFSRSMAAMLDVAGSLRSQIERLLRAR